jgi:hypothetical protein
LTVLTFIACGQKNPANGKVLVENNVISLTDSLQTFTITKASIKDFTDAKKNYQDKTLYDTLAFKKRNGLIKLPIEEKWKPFITFNDTLVNTDNSDIKQYRYLGQFEKIGFYIIGGSFWEHYECYLINKKTGKQTITWNDPSISPDSKYLANLSMPYGLDGVPNGIQIWHVNKLDYQTEPFTIEKHIEIDQQIWSATDFTWESNNSLILKVALVEKFLNENGEPNEKDFYYLRIKIKG